ncbi:hypothetical protein BV898_05307 [Hypsibius exemplaris]|uniref:Protein F37C4.5 n=1 Tax=Hypsibius exemplaris TaxID=2072580 RepID=A0A1W0WZW8_HYPEX|nr:hypothetical protein BV898_05307 [Hypsibius exemplaris]
MAEEEDISLTDPFITTTNNHSDAPVTHVTVFQEGAIVTRTWTKSLQPGIHHLRFKNFVQLYVGHSLRVKVHGSARLQEVSDIAASSELANSAGRYLQERQQKLADLNREKTDLQTQLAFAEKRLETWEAYRQVVMGNTTGPPAAIFKDGAFVDFHDFLWKYEGEYIRLQSLLQQTKDNLRTINDRLHRYINHAPPAFCKVSDVKIVLDVKATANVRVDITYEAREAGWVPRYDMQFAVADRQVQVSYYAHIQQWTGEDWNDAEITVAARNPPLSVDLDDSSRREEDAEPYSAVMEKQKKGAGAAARASRAASSETLASQAFIVETVNHHKQEIIHLTPFHVKLPGKHSLGHEKSLRLAVGAFKMEAIFRHQIKPQTDMGAYISAVVVNQCDYTLLAGLANIYLDGDYACQVLLGNWKPQEDLNMRLAADSKIEIVTKPRRKVTAPIRGNEGVDKVEEDHSIEYDIRNDRKHPISISVLVPVPVISQDDEKLTIIFPKATKQQTDSGFLNQTVEVPAGITRSVKFLHKRIGPFRLT